MPVNLVESGPEWVQLTYTSADSARAAHGGWGIKESTPGATETDIACLRHGVTTRIKEVEETSQFASDAQLYQRPRRLSFMEIDGKPTLWHAVTAGADATGRPGNVFTHAATLVSEPGDMRPIEYWRSDDWLTPFGANAVTNAHLGSLRSGAAVTRGSVTSFVGEADRLYALEWLLAAVAHVAETHRSMVLATETPDEAAQWLGAFSYLTAPALARRISWVTFERADGVEAAAARGFKVICVPRSDLSVLVDAPPRNVLLADPTWVLDDPAGGTWLSKAGQRFPDESTWQNAALDVLALNPDHSVRVLASIDELTESIAPDEAEQLPFSWPLSMALLADGDAAVANRGELLRECLALAPDSTLDTSIGKRLVEELVRGQDRGVLDGLLSDARVGKALEGAISVDLAAAYLAGAWRTGVTPPRLSKRVIAAVKQAHDRSITAAIEHAEAEATADPDRVVPAAKLVSFLLANDLDPLPTSDDPPSLVERVVELLEGRLADPEVNLSDLDMEGLHPSLLGRLRRGATAAPVAHDRAQGYAMDPAHALTPKATTLSSAPVRSPVRVPRQDEVAEGIAELLRMAEPGSVRARAIAECLLLACGHSATLLDLTPELVVQDSKLALAAGNLIAAEPIRGRGVAIRADQALVDALWRAGERAPTLKLNLTGCLTIFWAMAESGVIPLRDGLGTQPPSDLFDAVRRDAEPFISTLAGFMQDAPTAFSARLLCTALERQLDRPSGSVLAASTLGASSLGWSAVKRAARTMDEQALRSIFAKAEPRLVELVGALGEHRVFPLISEVEPPDPEPPMLEPGTRRKRLERRR